MTDAATHRVIEQVLPVRPTGVRAWWPGFVRFLRKKPLGAIGLGIVIFFVLVSLFAPVIGRYDPDEIFFGAEPELQE